MVQLVAKACWAPLFRMVIELMLISGVGFSAVCTVALSGAVDQGAEKLGW